MLEELSLMFVGRQVRISHDVEWLQPIDGQCRSVQSYDDGGKRFWLDTEGNRYDIVVETMGSGWIIGPLPDDSGVMRKIEVVEPGSEEEE